MAKPSIITLLLSSLFVASCFLPLAYSEPKLTHIRFYLQGSFNTSQPIEYGDVFAFQEIITVGSDPNSAFLGYSQGTLAFANNQGALTLYDLHVSLTYSFHSGEYNGSTVVAVGKVDMTQAVREFPIVGGTGAFRLARGTVIGTTFSDEPPIYIYDLEIIQEQSRSGGIQMYV